MSAVQSAEWVDLQCTPEAQPDDGINNGPRHRISTPLLTGLMLSIGTLLAALLLTVRPDGRVALRFWQDHPLPESCPSKIFFDQPCPGCGMTRSVVSLANGHWAESWHYHRLGWAIVLLCIVLLPGSLYRLIKPHAKPVPRWIGQGIPFVLFAALLINWIYNLIWGT